MCGICGTLNFNGQKADRSLLESMADALVHRGPDAHGYYISGNAGLGHRRLAIIDLNTGDQPLHNENSTVWTVVNGEIYNYHQLREMLEAKGHRFYTNTDSEVVVHLYEEYKEDCVKHLRGMFAFALWDDREKLMFLARDRLGKKPIVYWHDEKQERFIFASEIKAVLQAPFIKKEVDIQALNLYLTFLYVPAPWTMFKGIKKLPPAHYMIIKGKNITLKRYWHLELNVGNESPAAYEEGLLQQLDEAVRIRLMSDVPLGAFLSGGIDSSAIVGIMSKHMQEPVKTFSIGFEEKLYNELFYARIAARLFKTDHHELVIRPQAIDILPKIIHHYGEPFADYSCIPTYFVSQFAASKVKVALTGDGGDESFAGYYRYTACQAAEIFDRMPRFVSKIGLALLSCINKSHDIRTIRWQVKRFFRSLQYPALKRYLNWIAAFNEQEKKQLLCADVLGKVNLEQDLDFLASFHRQYKNVRFLDAVIQTDINTYLPFDLLVKTDIASMANSLEARSPFLDHKLMEYAATIPLSLKLHNFNNKYILKRSLRGMLPDSIIHRTKKGFGVPMGQWFRGQLKGFMQDILLDEKSRARGYFQINYIKQLIDDHMSEKSDNCYKLWAVLLFELWHREFID
ncbi:MAG: asparagine synthase (glutamine-hydrolyzing) [Candidatus Omnitrophica bacterium]|nr:asparagine synthase (glutamine-hydrolyzing) [Candidatus Omnitrophota bacterium]MBU4477590.1 asparagine synthase (glutamine-hydrolyzing) [Candidatus Omnitrophota bacterium]MCG2703617.1 asparagine synthase (glutamine-hydrolyzing) [Candidatus Omnitrophota bacterium]